MFIDTHSQSMAPRPASNGSEATQCLLHGRREFIGYLRRRLGGPDEAEDAFQDFSLKVIRATRSPDQGEKINAWLGRILRNTLIDHYRRRAVRLRAETAYAQEMQTADTATEADRGRRPCRCLHAALPTLRADYTEILRRADLEEEPRSQIAADLGLTTNNLNVRLHRARLALKKELEKSCPACRNGSFLECECG